MKEEKSEAKSGESEWRESKVKENAKNSVQAQKPMVPAGRGVKNNDRVRLRNRRYKIKRYMLQPRI